ncbi:hypothetical protein LPJ53_002622 [Coemansia erecta]|uniref:Pentatricopeptide repeat-containing protein n=1 Tax=Coemansia erecta TaxID=147472 RepID=A0A9W7Y2X7_9FUNG|nr:hypothetical protein LPJ53_002622 [Coemansia erecta]
MLAPGTAPTRRRAMATMLQAAAANLHSAWRGHHSTAGLPLCLRRTHTTAGIPCDKLAVNASTRTPTLRVVTGHTRGDNGLLGKFHTAVRAGDVNVAVEIYTKIRLQFDKRMCRRRSGHTAELVPEFAEMRTFHIMLRRHIADPGTDVARREQMLQLIVSVVEDMRGLGLRVGATETSAHVFACVRLGWNTRAIEIWRSSMDSVYSENRDGGGNESLANTVHHMFPQTHAYAIQAAVAMKDAKAVREIYYRAIGALRESLRVSGDRPAQKALLTVFYALFPTLQDRRNGSKSSSDRRWDPARLGSGFLEKVSNDVREWIGKTDRQLYTRVAQYTVRALFIEGHWQYAVEYYSRLPEDTSGAEVLCETVIGLCGRGMADRAHAVLLGTNMQYRNLYVWNAYFDGLVGYPIAKLDDAIKQMVETDHIDPDIVTWSIWMRACLRQGDWRRAYRCFRENHCNMRADVVCWDIVVRGLLGCTSSDSLEARVTGWQVVGEFIDLADGNIMPFDVRMVETILLHAFPRFRRTASDSMACDLLSKQTLDRVTRWIESNMSKSSRTTFAIVIGSLLRSAQFDGALDLHQFMVDKKLWPTKSINCMIVRALALAGSEQKSRVRTAPYLDRAEEFINTKVPKQHYGGAYLPLVKCAAQERRYADMWGYMDRWYPCVRDSGFIGIFPDSDMYQAVLRSAEINT